MIQAASGLGYSETIDQVLHAPSVVFQHIQQAVSQQAT